MKLWCTSFIQFKQIAYKNEWDETVPDDIAIISICNSQNFEGEYHICNSENVLNLNFDDVSPESFRLSDDTESFTYQSYDGKEINLQFFTKSMADECVRFIERNKNKNFYIHCSAGISRSQAFVKYIKNVYNDINWITNPNNPCEFPNGFVYSQLMKSYREII